MAPEQAKGSPRAGHRVDVFALGGILKYLLEGKGPYGQDATSLQAVAEGKVELADCGPELEPIHVFPEAAEETDEAAPGADEGLNLAACLAAAERRQMAKALAMAEWNITKAAGLLGITRPTLRDRIRKYGLQRPSD